MKLQLSEQATAVARERLGLPPVPKPTIAVVVETAAAIAVEGGSGTGAAMVVHHKPTWRERYDTAADTLAAVLIDGWWPIGDVLPRRAADRPGGVPVKPLLLGGYDQLLAHTDRSLEARRAVGRLLGLWCRSRGYLAALAAEGSRRYSLDGSVVGDVSDDHRADARHKLTIQRKKKRC